MANRNSGATDFGFRSGAVLSISFQHFPPLRSGDPARNRPLRQPPIFLLRQQLLVPFLPKLRPEKTVEVTGGVVGVDKIFGEAVLVGDPMRRPVTEERFRNADQILFEVASRISARETSNAVELPGVVLVKFVLSDHVDTELRYHVVILYRNSVVVARKQNVVEGGKTPRGDRDPRRRALDRRCKKTRQGPAGPARPSHVHINLFFQPNLDSNLVKISAPF